MSDPDPGTDSLFGALPPDPNPADLNSAPVLTNPAPENESTVEASSVEEFPVEESPDDEPAGVEDVTRDALADHFEMTAQVDLHRRPNPHQAQEEGYGRERYPGVFEDFDQDNIPTVDDPHPLVSGDDTTVEETKLSEEIVRLIDFRKERAEVTEKTKNRLQRFLPSDATIKARTKTPYSILNKLRRKRLEGAGGITDVSGGMAIFRDFGDLKEARRLIEENEVLGPVREVENHYELPGPYRAVHYIIEADGIGAEGAPVEVQLKTQRLATLASAGHRPYKRGVQDKDEMDRLAELADRADRGDEEAAEQIDPILSDPERLRKRLTLEEARQNAGARENADTRENPNPGRERRQRQMAVDAHAGLLRSIVEWDPTREPTKIEQTTWYAGNGQHYNVLYAGVGGAGFSGEAGPLHFGFHGTRRIASHAVYKGDAGPLRVAEQGEPGIFLRITGGADYPDSLKKIEPGELTDSEFLREHGARGPRPAQGPPNLRTSFKTVQAGVLALTPPRGEPVRRAQVPSVGFGDEEIGPDPSEVTQEERTEALAEVARVLATRVLLQEEGGFEIRASDPDKAERAMRQAISNLQAAKKQIAYVLRQERSTFVHEFQHYIDVRRAEGRGPGSSTMIERGIPTEEYFNTSREVNARYQEGLFEFEETILSNESDLRRRMESGFGRGDLFRILKQLTPQFEKLDEENRQRLYKRWYRYWKEIVEPKMQEIRQEMGGLEKGGGLAEEARENPPAEATVEVPGGPSYTVEPGDIILREGAEHEELSREKIAGPPKEARELAQRARKWKEKGAPGMHETGLRRMLQIGAGYQLSPAEMTVVKNWFARKKSEKERGFHKFEEWPGRDEKRPSESLLSWWGWGGEPMMKWVNSKLAERSNGPRANAPEDRFDGEEHLDPDDYMTGFGTSLSEAQNTVTSEGVEGEKFKRWFGDWEQPEGHSVVTDEEGRPLEVYHGTDEGGFNRFVTGAELHGRGSPGVFWADRRAVAESYAGSDRPIRPLEIAVGDLLDDPLAWDVEVFDSQQRAYRVTDGEQVLDTVLERNPRFEERLGAYEEKGFDIEQTTARRFEVVHKGVVVLAMGTRAERDAALQKIVDQINARAEVPSQQTEGIMTGYLNLRDPVVVNWGGNPWTEGSVDGQFESPDDVARFARNAAFDGAIIKNILDPGPYFGRGGTPPSTEYLIFGADQVAVKMRGRGQIAIPRAATDPRLNDPRGHDHRRNEAEGDAAPSGEEHHFRSTLSVRAEVPTPGTERSYEVTDPESGAFAYGQTRRPDVPGRGPAEATAEVTWVELPGGSPGEMGARSERLGKRLMLDTLRFLRSTGARRVAVRAGVGAGRALAEALAQMGLLDKLDEAEDLLLYSISVGQAERTALDQAHPDLRFDASAEDVEAALAHVIGESKGRVSDPSPAMPWTFAQPHRPVGAAGDFEAEIGQPYEVTSSGDTGFTFRTERLLGLPTIEQAQIVPTGKKTQLAVAANAVRNHFGAEPDPEAPPQDPEPIHFGIANDTQEWIVEIRPVDSSEGDSTGGSGFRTIYRTPGRNPVDSDRPQQFGTLGEAIADAAHFVEEGDAYSFVPGEYVEATVQSWQDPRQNPSGIVVEEARQPDAIRAVAWALRRALWERFTYSLAAHRETGRLLAFADAVASGEIAPGDPRALQPLPLREMPTARREALGRLLSQISDHRTVSEWAADEVIPFVPEGGGAYDPTRFAPWKTEDLWAILRHSLSGASGWRDAQYVLPDGTALRREAALSFGAEGGAGARALPVPERFFREGIDPKKAYSSLLEVMERGAIRVSEDGAPGRLDVETHTELSAAQRRWLRRALRRPRPPASVDVWVAETNATGGTLRWAADAFAPSAAPIFASIRRFYSEDSSEEDPKTGRLGREATTETVHEHINRTYPEPGPSERANWILPGGTAIARGGRSHGQYDIPGRFWVSEDPAGRVRPLLLSRGAAQVRKRGPVLSMALWTPLTDAQKRALRERMAPVEHAEADVRAPRGRAEVVEEESVGDLIDRLDRCYRPRPSGAVVSTERANSEGPAPAPRVNPGGPAWVVPSAEAQSANLRPAKEGADSQKRQRLVTIRPERYLELLTSHYHHVSDSADRADAERAASREGAVVSEARIESLKQHMRERRPLDPAWLDVLLKGEYDPAKRGSPITKQEGRHRALAARELGMEHMPLVLFARGMKAGTILDSVPRPTALGEEGSERDFPDRIVAGTRAIEWPERSTPTDELWRAAVFGIDPKPVEDGEV